MTDVGQVVALRRSGLLQICIELLTSHHDDGTGIYAGCGGLIEVCPARRNGRKVIAAAGLNPAKFELSTLLERCSYVRHEQIGSVAWPS